MSGRDLTDRERAAAFRVLAIIFVGFGLVAAFTDHEVRSYAMLTFSWLSLIYARTFELKVDK